MLICYAMPSIHIQADTEGLMLQDRVASFGVHCLAVWLLAWVLEHALHAVAAHTDFCW